MGSVRRVLQVVGLASLAARVWAGEPAVGRLAWPIPAVAWRVPIGAVGRGVPIGGIGAGSIMVNSGGSFGPWHFKVGFPELDRRLAAAAFHFYEKPEGRPARVTTLSAQRLMPAWRELPPNAGTYHALYPKGWFAYRCFTADVAMKYFSPIIKGNVKETSYPVAVFEFAIGNPTDQPIDVGVMLSFPNAAAHTEELRSGFFNVPEPEREGIVAVVLDADYEHNPPAAQGTTWCIGVRAEQPGEPTFVTSWNAMASGGDLLREFSDDGRLPNGALDATDSAAAVAYRTQLAPKQTVTVPFALSWDFPLMAFGTTLWRRRYAAWFEEEAEGRVSAVAGEALRHHAEWEAAIDAWVQPILDEPAYPDWLKQAALNELYYDAFGGIFWEAGCTSQPEEFKNLHPDDHKYFALASPAQPLCEPLALRPAASPHLLALWPEIERDVLRTYADLVLDAPSPAVHDLGSPSGNPVLQYNMAPHPKTKDLPALFILQTYACYRATQDRAFLDHVWPACVKCADAMLQGRPYADGLPRHEGDDAVSSPCTLHGVSLLCGGLWVAAYEALEQMATVRGDERASSFGHLARRARASLDRRLWRRDLRYYAIDTHSRRSDALASGALLGLRFAQATGLEPILPTDRLQSHLHQAFQRCVRPFRDYNRDGVGDCGAINVIDTDRCPPNTGTCHEVSVAATYQLAATMCRLGRDLNDQGLMDKALKTARGAWFQTWAVEPDKPLWAFATPEAWHAAHPARARANQHYGARAVWDLLLEIKDPFAPVPATE